MALLQSRLHTGCCSRPKFTAKYHNDLKDKISKRNLARDLKDLSKEYHSDQPSCWIFKFIPVAVLVLGIAGCLLC